MLNILTESVMRCRRYSDRLAWTSLPEAYVALMANEVEAFPALRPHQRHAWHALLVQLGAMAMHRDGLDTPPSDAGEWRRIIQALTPDWPGDEPWQLVVDDITRPAFMQPPASSQDREKDFKNTVTTPDDLDMLVTSKNHDLKSEVAEQDHPPDHGGIRRRWELRDFANERRIGQPVRLCFRSSRSEPRISRTQGH